MTSLPAKVTAVEKRGDQYQVIVQISTKSRGSFNTLAFGEIKPYSGSLKDGRLDLVYFRDSRLRGWGSVPALDSALTGFVLPPSRKATARQDFAELSRGAVLEKPGVLEWRSAGV